MRMFLKRLTLGGLGVLLLSVMASAQKAAPHAPAAKPPAPAVAPAQMPAAQPQPRVIIVEPVRVFDPFFDYPYPYAYPPDYMAQNFGYVKIDSKMKDAKVYVDGGYADKLAKAKKFALRPGNHDIQLRDSDGRTLAKERVYVMLGNTTELKFG